MLREETRNEWNAIIFLRRRRWRYVVTTEKWKRKGWRKTQLFLTIGQTQLKVMCECGPMRKNIADLCHLSWRAAEMVFGMSVKCAFPSRHASPQLFTSKHWFLLSVLTQVSPNPHAEHTHQWSGKSMACNWATWSSEHTRMQCPAVWNETNERSAEKQMIFRVQRSGVSASGMSHLSLIRPLLTNTPNFAIGTIPKMSRCLVQEQMLGAQNHQRWMEREGWLYNYSGKKETSVMNCGKTSGFNSHAGCLEWNYYNLKQPRLSEESSLRQFQSKHFQ